MKIKTAQEIATRAGVSKKEFGERLGYSVSWFNNACYQAKHNPDFELGSRAVHRIKTAFPDEYTQATKKSFLDKVRTGGGQSPLRLAEKAGGSNEELVQTVKKELFGLVNAGKAIGKMGIVLDDNLLEQIVESAARHAKPEVKARLVG